MENATFNYTYAGQAISRTEFERNVPKDWRDHVDAYGSYSWGSYSANERDQ